MSVELAIYFLGLLLALGAAVAGVLFALCLIDAVVASYFQLLTRGRFIDLDAHDGLIAPVGFLKRKLKAKSWCQMVIRIWLLALAQTVSGGCLMLLAGLVQAR